ncbi:ribbon-helix-helix protein, CopG family [Saccharomonospora iraqiensis]|uniref:ribbon-helix-helix protein, CopG family n=1 Tax=Saccharomonospora iraqiensis TaxID=52698 RepID=UPI00022E7BF9|nr:ribbon-helix-helix protein, CopG family [Saccharomonospora iraqiensis]
MTERHNTDIDRMLAATAAEYEGEDRAAAAEEARESTSSAVFSVRLPPHIYEAVREAAARAHLTPSALIRQWVSERVEDDPGDRDLSEAVAALRRDVERLARLAPPA